MKCKHPDATITIKAIEYITHNSTDGVLGDCNANCESTGLVSAGCEDCGVTLPFRSWDKQPKWVQRLYLQRFDESGYER